MSLFDGCGSCLIKDDEIFSLRRNTQHLSSVIEELRKANREFANAALEARDQYRKQYTELFESIIRRRPDATTELLSKEWREVTGAE